MFVITIGSKNGDHYRSCVVEKLDEQISFKFSTNKKPEESFSYCGLANKVKEAFSFDKDISIKIINLDERGSEFVREHERLHALVSKYYS